MASTACFWTPYSSSDECTSYLWFSLAPPSQYFAIHKKIYDWFDISFDYFGRTSCDNPADSKDWPQTQASGRTRALPVPHVCVVCLVPYWVPCLISDLPRNLLGSRA